MVREKWTSAEKVFQHQRITVQGAGAEGQAAGDERGRAAEAAGDEWHAGEAATGRGGGLCADRVQGERVGRKANEVNFNFNKAIFVSEYDVISGRRTAPERNGLSCAREFA